MLGLGNSLKRWWRAILTSVTASDLSSSLATLDCVLQVGLYALSPSVVDSTSESATYDQTLTTGSAYFIAQTTDSGAATYTQTTQSGLYSITSLTPIGPGGDPNLNGLATYTQALTSSSLWNRTNPPTTELATCDQTVNEGLFSRTGVFDLLSAATLGQVLESGSYFEPENSNRSTYTQSLNSGLWNSTMVSETDLATLSGLLSSGVYNITGVIDPNSATYDQTIQSGTYNTTREYSLEDATADQVLESGIYKIDQNLILQEDLFAILQEDGGEITQES